VEAYPDALAHSSRIFLSTYEVKEGPEGELHCYLAKRAPAFLDRVRAVIVNSNAFVEVMYDRFRHPREKFVVHHQVVDPPPRPPRPARDASRPLRIIWVARFDDPERIRVFADVVELCVSAQLQVEWHAYGNSPVVEDGGNADALARLARRGVTLRVEPSDRDPIDTDAYDAIVLLPSEAEGLHPALLEAIAGRLPVVAPMVGDVGDLLDHTTAFSVSTPEAVADYVQAFTAISEDSAEVQERVEAAFRLLDREFSWSAFRRRVEDTGDYVWAADGPAGHGRERPKTAS
jgi:glycosyltransferase involved in cell wall biosynthesis